MARLLLIVAYSLFFFYTHAYATYSLSIVERDDHTYEVMGDFFSLIEEYKYSIPVVEYFFNVLTLEQKELLFNNNSYKNKIRSLLEFTHNNEPILIAEYQKLIELYFTEENSSFSSLPHPLEIRFPLDDFLAQAPSSAIHKSPVLPFLIDYWSKNITLNSKEIIPAYSEFQTLVRENENLLNVYNKLHNKPERECTWLAFQHLSKFYKNLGVQSMTDFWIENPGTYFYINLWYKLCSRHNIGLDISLFSQITIEEIFLHLSLLSSDALKTFIANYESYRAVLCAHFFRALEEQYSTLRLKPALLALIYPSLLEHLAQLQQDLDQWNLDRARVCGMKLQRKQVQPFQALESAFKLVDSFAWGTDTLCTMSVPENDYKIGKVLNLSISYDEMAQLAELIFLSQSLSFELKNNNLEMALDDEYPAINERSLMDFLHEHRADPYLSFLKNWLEKDISKEVPPSLIP